MKSQRQQQGQLKCFTVSASEVKHTSPLPGAGDIDFHSASTCSFSLSLPLTLPLISFIAFVFPRLPFCLPHLFTISLRLPPL